MRTIRFALLPLCLVLAVAGCTKADEGTDPITTQLSPVSTTATTLGVASATGTTAAPGGPESTVPTDQSSTPTTPRFPEYAIVQRTTGSAGDIVVVLLDEQSYDALTDIDLQNVVADIVERFPPIAEAYVVDDASAVPLVLRDDLTGDEQAVLSEHHFLTLEDGFRIVFAGPFESSGDLILGS